MKSNTDEYEEVFDDFLRISKLGPRASASQYPDAASRSYVQRYLEIANGLVGGQRQLHASMPNVYINFFCHPSLNAFALEHETVAYIGVSTGTLTVLSTVFQLMLSDRRVLADIGRSRATKTGRTRRPRKLVSGPLHDARSILPLFTTSKKNMYSNDPMRRALAEHLARMAFYFLIFHECSHVARGHLGYLKERGHAFHFESDTEQAPVSKEAYIQALEVDADSSAIAMMKNVMNSNRNHPERLSANVRPFYSNPRTTYRHGLFAILMLFRLFEEPVRGRLGTARDHPFAPIRESYAITRLVHFLTSAPVAADATDWMDLVRQVAADVKQGIGVLRGRTGPAELEYAAKDSEAVQHVNDLLALFAEMKDELQQHAYVDLSGYG